MIIAVTCIDSKPNSYDQPIVTSSAATVPVFPAEALMRYFQGLGVEDFSALRYVRDQLKATGLYEDLYLLADPDEPCDLYGMLLRAAMQTAA